MKKHSVLAAGFAGILFFGISFLTLGAVLPSLRDTLHLDVKQMSLLAGVLPLGVLSGSVVFGPWCDRFGFKIPFLTASALIVLGFLGLSSFQSLSPLSACVFLIGTGGGILNGVCNALVTDISDDRNRSSNLSLLGMFYGIGALTMPLVLGLFHAVPYTIILRYVALLLFGVFVYFCFVPFPRSKIKQGFPLKEGLSLLRQPLLLLISFILFFQSALEGLCSNWIPVFLQESPSYGLDQERALFLLTFLVAGMTAGRVVLSWLTLRLRPGKVLWGYLLLIFAGFSGLAAVWPPVVSVLLIGTGLGATFPVLIACIGTQYKALSGTAIGIAMAIALTGNVLLNYLLRFFPIHVFPFYLLCILSVMMGLYLFMTKKLRFKNI